METLTERPSATEPAVAPLTWRPLLRPLAYWSASRVLVVAAIAGMNRITDQGQTVAEALHLWDGNWYLSAASGYQYPTVPVGVPTGQVNIAFFPLYPMLIRAVEAVTPLTQLASAIVVAWLFGAVTAVLLWLLVRRISGHEAADRGVALFSFFPGAATLSLVYSEAVMLAFAAACMLALLSRRWVAAGVLAALAGLARPSGIVLAACCAWAALWAVGRDRDWRALAAPVLAPMGTLAYVGWLWHRTGQADIWLRVQREGWYEQVDFGRRTVEELVFVVRDVPGAPLHFLVPVLGLLFVAGAAVCLWFWRPPGILVVYTVGIVALSLLSRTLGARPRFVMTAFPLVLAVAWALRGTRFSVVLAMSAAGSAFLAMAYSVPRLLVP